MHHTQTFEAHGNQVGFIGLGLLSLPMVRRLPAVALDDHPASGGQQQQSAWHHQAVIAEDHVAYRFGGAARLSQLT